MILDALPNILNKPPARPLISFGAVSAITAQPNAPTPFPKKAIDINKITSPIEST